MAHAYWRGLAAMACTLRPSVAQAALIRAHRWQDGTLDGAVGPAVRVAWTTRGLRVVATERRGARQRRYFRVGREGLLPFVIYWVVGATLVALYAVARQFLGARVDRALGPLARRFNPAPPVTLATWIAEAPPAPRPSPGRTGLFSSR